jgi:hypothetical protein
LFLFLASFDFLLSLASPGISIPSAALGPRQHHWSFPRAAASGRTPSYVLGAVTDCSGASCTGSGACLSSVAVCSTPGASGGTCSDVLCSATVSTIVGLSGRRLARWLLSLRPMTAPHRWRAARGSPLTPSYNLIKAQLMIPITICLYY